MSGIPSTSGIPGYRTEPEQAKRLGRTPRTLQLWRLQGLIGYTKVGPTVLYTDENEREFLKSREVAPVRARSRRERAVTPRLPATPSANGSFGRTAGDGRARFASGFGPTALS